METRTRPGGRARALWLRRGRADRRRRYRFDGGVSVGCGGTASGFSTTVVVSAGGGGGGCLAGVWAKSGLAQALKPSASAARASVRASEPPLAMYAAPRPQPYSLCDCDTPAWLSAAEKLGLASKRREVRLRRQRGEGLLVRRQRGERRRILADAGEGRRIGRNRRESLRIAERRLARRRRSGSRRWQPRRRANARRAIAANAPPSSAARRRWRASEGRALLADRGNQLRVELARIAGKSAERRAHSSRLPRTPADRPGARSSRCGRSRAAGRPAALCDIGLPAAPFAASSWKALASCGIFAERVSPSDMIACSAAGWPASPAKACQWPAMAAQRLRLPGELLEGQTVAAERLESRVGNARGLELANRAGRTVDRGRQGLLLPGKSLERPGICRSVGEHRGIGEDRAHRRLVAGELPEAPGA